MTNLSVDNPSTLHPLPPTQKKNWTPKSTTKTLYKRFWRCEGQ